MAGAGYKLFNTGDVLTAAQVNTYLMEQTVMVFANAAARTTALSGVVSEGMISYLKDTNAVEVYDGSNWVSSDDPNAIQNTIVDAKGDLISASAADVPARLAVGNNGETLVADSSTSTGLRWQVPKTQNAVYNSSFQVWQRGTSASFGSASAGTGYIADRWQFIYTGASGTASRQLTNDTTNLPNIQYCARVQRNSGQTSTQNVILSQTLENIDSARFIGQTITFSFWARRGSNFSQGSNLLNVVVASGTGTDQNIMYTMTGGVNAVNTTATLTTTWQRFTFTGTVSATGTQIGYYIYYAPSGTAGANDFFEITGIQLETGSVATPYTSMGGNIAGEFLACCRYYQKLMDAAEQGSEMICMMRASSTTATNGGHVQLLTPMRTAPTITMPAVSGNYYYEGGSSLSTVSTTQASPRRFRVDTTGTGLTAGQAVWLTLAGSTAQVTASAEL